jgi:hypothetical protein
MKARRKKPSIKSKAALHAFIHSAHGIFKRKPGEKPFAEWMAEMKAEEKALEEAKFIRMERVWHEPHQSATNQPG